MMRPNRPNSTDELVRHFEHKTFAAMPNAQIKNLTILSITPEMLGFPYLWPWIQCL